MEYRWSRQKVLAGWSQSQTEGTDNGNVQGEGEKLERLVLNVPVSLIIKMGHMANRNVRMKTK